MLAILAVFFNFWILFSQCAGHAVVDQFDYCMRKSSDRILNLNKDCIDQKKFSGIASKSYTIFEKTKHELEGIAYKCTIEHIRIFTDVGFFGAYYTETQRDFIPVGNI